MRVTGMFHQLVVSGSWTGPKDQRTKVSSSLALVIRRLEG